MVKISREEAYELIGFNDVKLRLVAIPFFSLLFPWLVMGVNPFTDPIVFVINIFVSLVHIIIYWQIDRWVVLILLKKYSNYTEYSKRVAIEIVLIILITCTLCFVSYFLKICFVRNGFYVSTFTFLLGSLIMTMIIVSIYEARHAFEMYKKGLLRNEKLLKENTKAQLEVLKNQVNPHFFFNSINTLISVIPENTTIAVNFAENLSHVYRCILDMKDKEVVSLAEEFSCISAYKYLLKIRFSDQVKFVGDNILYDLQDEYIVPMSVQMLVENAVKHNVVSQSRPLTINFEIKDDHLIVSNARQPKSMPENSTKIGLKNIDQRYKLLVNKSIQIEETEKQFSVHLPIIKISEVK